MRRQYSGGGEAGCALVTMELYGFYSLFIVFFFLYNFFICFYMCFICFYNIFINMFKLFINIFTNIYLPTCLPTCLIAQLPAQLPAAKQQPLGTHFEQIWKTTKKKAAETYNKNICKKLINTKNAHNVFYIKNIAHIEKLPQNRHKKATTPSYYILPITTYYCYLLLSLLLLSIITITLSVPIATAITITTHHY